MITRYLHGRDIWIIWRCLWNCCQRERSYTITIYREKDSFGHQGNSLQFQIFQPQAPKGFARPTPIPFHSMELSFFLTIRLEEIPNNFLNLQNMRVTEHPGRGVINIIRGEIFLTNLDPGSKRQASIMSFI